MIAALAEMIRWLKRSNVIDFSGLVGLPLLRLLEYGGDADWFWLRPASTSP